MHMQENIRRSTKIRNVSLNFRYWSGVLSLDVLGWRGYLDIPLFCTGCCKILGLLWPGFEFGSKWYRAYFDPAEMRLFNLQKENKFFRGRSQSSLDPSNPCLNAADGELHWLMAPHALVLVDSVFATRTRLLGNVALLERSVWFLIQNRTAVCSTFL